MKIISSCIALVLMLMIFSPVSHAAESGLDIEKVLAVVPVTGKDVDKSVYRQFDRLVPELKRISKSKIIKLECRYAGRTDREQDVQRAYLLAARIERYLRVQHKLELDMWVAIDMTPKTSKSAPTMTIAVFSDEIRQLDAVPVDPQKETAQ